MALGRGISGGLSGLHHRQGPARQAVVRGIGKLPATAEPIVISDSHIFMELAYYAPPEVRRRLLFPAGRELGRRYLKYESEAILMSGLGRRTSLPITSLDGVLADRAHFVAVEAQREVMPDYLAGLGYRMAPILRAPGVTVLEVAPL